MTPTLSRFGKGLAVDAWPDIVGLVMLKPPAVPLVVKGCQIGDLFRSTDLGGDSVGRAYPSDHGDAVQFALWRHLYPQTQAYAAPMAAIRRLAGGLSFDPVPLEACVW